MTDRSDRHPRPLAGNPASGLSTLRAVIMLVIMPAPFLVAALLFPVTRAGLKRAGLLLPGAIGLAVIATAVVVQGVFLLSAVSGFGRPA